ncbi:hypothetical protein D9758_012350 [Tetrapyrgos nigripes]|uniref:Major facilitator superfamily (MFS) profile domain-containing protein n=1 Tax=Tetrapyrgos nigripes TaxID=182062 RepID=A0A8H5CM51_9AGAR|nr:hypothetical protein D9758_012350 [Tetrapyrgos nigripes]
MTTTLELKNLSRTSNQLDSEEVHHENRYQVDENAPVAIESRTSTPVDVSSGKLAKWQIMKKRIHFAVFCFGHLLSGWNDGSAGPLLPRIQQVYQIKFTIASLIFVLACAGFVSGALANLYLSEKVKMGKILVLAALLQLVSFAIQAPGLPFPAFVASYFLTGAGIALQHAQSNSYVASLDTDNSARLSVFHAMYGFGAFSAPLVATQFSQMPRWSFYYLVSMGIASLNLLLILSVFRLRSKDDCRAEIGLEPSEKGTSDHSVFRQIFGLRSVHTLAAFIFVYVGTEVTIGGWIVTFVIQRRGGGADSGYISSGFFGGLMLGRLILLPLNKLLGLRRVVILYALLSIGLELTVWFVPSLVENGVAVSCIGVLLGPLYPIAVSVAGTVIPKWLFTGSIGWIAGFGQAGGAALPFITGTMADGVGISSLHPLLVAMMCVMAGLWTLIPKPLKTD